MSDYKQLLPLPARTDIDTGLSPASQSTMLQLLGRPGELLADCSELTNLDLEAHIGGWFWAAGYRTVVDSMHSKLADESVRELFGGGCDAAV